MTYYNITITINNVESSNLDKLESICEIMESVCETICDTCDYETVKRLDPPYYELKEEENDDANRIPR